MTLAGSELSTLLIAARMSLWKSHSKPGEHVTKYNQTSPVLKGYSGFKDSVRVFRGFGFSGLCSEDRAPHCTH
jgi:hypothetical protein